MRVIPVRPDDGCERVVYAEMEGVHRFERHLEVKLKGLDAWDSGTKEEQCVRVTHFPLCN